MDGSFVRIRDITLGYALPTRFTSAVSATRARLYVRAQDPFIFTKYKGWDPEAGFNAGNGNSQQSQALTSKIEDQFRAVLDQSTMARPRVPDR